MLNLEKIECECTSASTNAENMGGGDDTRLGMSMYVTFLASNELLDKLDSKLRPALYERAANDSQEDLTGHLPQPKFKGLESIKWPYVGEGYQAIIHAALDANEDRVIEDCKVDKILFSPKADGAVAFKLRLYFHPGLDEVGPLAALEKHHITLSLEPPAVNQVDAVEPEEESPQQDLLAQNDESPTAEHDAEVDVLYPRAVAAVRSTGNPTLSAIQTELKIGPNHAALLLARMESEGVIEQDEESGEYIVVAEDDAA